MFAEKSDDVTFAQNLRFPPIDQSFDVQVDSCGPERSFGNVLLLNITCLSSASLASNLLASRFTYTTPEY